MTQSVRERRFLGLILVIAMVAIGASGCAKRSSVLPGFDSATSGNTVDKGTIGTESSAPPSFTSVDQPATDRKIIFNASLALDVDDAEKAFSDCEAHAAKYGGFRGRVDPPKSDTQVVATPHCACPRQKPLSL